MENNIRLLNSKTPNDFKSMSTKYSRIIQKEFSEIINKESIQNSKVSGSNYFKKGNYNVKQVNENKADKSISKSPRFNESRSYVLNKTKDFFKGDASKRQHSSNIASDYMELNGSYRKKMDYNINTGIRAISANKSRNKEVSSGKSSPTWQALINKGSNFFTTSIKTYTSSKFPIGSASMTPSSRRVIDPDSFPNTIPVSSKRFFQQSTKMKHGIIEELIAKTPIDDFSTISKKKVLSNKSWSQIKFDGALAGSIEKPKLAKKEVNKKYVDTGLAGLSTHTKNELSNKSIENRILLQSSSTMSELLCHSPIGSNKNLADMIK